MTYDIRIAGTDLRFACEGNQNILDAALKAGIEMPYSCRKGVCGNCAGGVSAGAVECPPAGEVTPPGKHLFCQCHPLSDLAIVPEAWHRVTDSRGSIVASTEAMGGREACHRSRTIVEIAR